MCVCERASLCVFSSVCNGEFESVHKPEKFMPTLAPSFADLVHGKEHFTWLACYYLKDRLMVFLLSFPTVSLCILPYSLVLTLRRPPR